jgi:EpsD family peptidyl-prolyl cis-trans isomerase
MKMRTLLIFVAAAGVTLAGCDKVKHMFGGKPSGQVVATVNGEEITALELKAELGNFATQDPKVMKAAQQQALQQIIMRRLVAQEARAQKLDKTPDFSMQLKRGEEALLAQALERKLVSGLTPPTQRDAENFVLDHPDQFANRRILTLDQVIAPAAKVDPKKLKALGSLDDVKKQFDTDGVPYQVTQGQLDTLTTPPGLITAINKLPANEVFVLPQRGAYVFSRVADQKSEPFRGDMATNYAMRVLGQQRQQDTVRKHFDTARKEAEAKIVYAPGFKPPPPTKGAPAAPAPAAPAAAAPAGAPADGAPSAAAPAATDGK